MEQYEKDRKWLFITSLSAIAYTVSESSISKINLGFIAMNNAGSFLGVAIFLLILFFYITFYQSWRKAVYPSMHENIDNYLLKYLTSKALDEIRQDGPSSCSINYVDRKLDNIKLIDLSKSWFIYDSQTKRDYLDIRIQLTYPYSVNCFSDIGHVVYHYSERKLRKIMPKFWISWALHESIFVKDILPYFLGFIGIVSIVISGIS
ncbi:hypothetical protein G3R49_06795 [Shewanella sp. WXL01]|uniref:hypothetical protein n=1 Tax=Shewanella sp. WXL01 TaxID=2709721 RepID=UPI0014383F0F|nr:hypothetical protein [Shewanella sp. WXL01]NKF50280.1 hypothetical protein [Shewanella sp. WXL01]